MSTRAASRRRQEQRAARARRRREEERGGPRVTPPSQPATSQGVVLSAELKYELAVRSHSATTVTTRLTKRPYILASTFLPLLCTSTAPFSHPPCLFCREIVSLVSRIDRQRAFAFYMTLYTGVSCSSRAGKKSRRLFYVNRPCCLSRQSNRCCDQRRCFPVDTDDYISIHVLHSFLPRRVIRTA